MLTRALAAVAVLALTFTAVNVTMLAVRHGVPWPTALLLDPMLALTLGTLLLTDARLAELGTGPPGWAILLRWFAGLATWILNIWTSLWPRDRVGVPRDADVTGVVLHSIPPALLILLAEAVAAYRRRIAALTSQSVPAVTPVRDAELALSIRETRPMPDTADSAAYVDGDKDIDLATDPLLAAGYAFDQAERARTGRPATVRALRAHFRIGQARAQALHRLLAHSGHRVAGRRGASGRSGEPLPEHE